MSGYFWETRSVHFIRQMLKCDDIRLNLLAHVCNPYIDIHLDKLNDPNLVVYCIFIDGKRCGIALFSRIKDKHWVDIGFLPGFRGKEALKLCKKVGLHYKNKYGIEKLYARIKIENKRSLFFAFLNDFSITNRDNQYYYLEKVSWVE